MVRKQSAEIDPLLKPLLLPAGDQQVDDILSQLIASHADPVIRGIISYKLHLYCNTSNGQTDAGDIYQEAVLHLLEAIRQLRERPDDNPVSDLRGLAAVITHRACSRWMRRQFPERHAFKNRLYYILTRQRGFALWRNKNKKLIAGFASWEGVKNITADLRLERLVDDEVLRTRIRLLKTRKQTGQTGQTGQTSQTGDEQMGHEDWGGTLAAIFDYLGNPVEFDKLAGTLAVLLQYEDQPLESIEDIKDTVGFEAAAGGRDAAWQVEKRIFLQRLWEEINQLPPNQRVALLLNLRDTEGGGGITLFPALRIATIQQLAEAMEMSAEELAGMWNELPLEDTRIAQMLRLTRQQVINVRKAARKRLTRRMKGFN
jgi:RNA polymerase sigma factor (sigma-70 family)